MDISLPVTTFFHNGSCIPYRTVAIKLLPEEKKIKFPQLDDKYRLSIIEFTRDSSKSVTLTSDGLKITFANDSTTLGLVSHLESAIANIMSNDDMISHSTQGGGIRASKSSKSNSDSSSKVPKKLDVLPNRKKEKQSSQQHIAQAHSARFGKLALQTQQHSRRSAIMIKSINSDSRQQSSNTFRVPDISEHEQQAKTIRHVISQPITPISSTSSSSPPRASVLQKRKGPATGQYGDNYEGRSYQSPVSTKESWSSWYKHPESTTATINEKRQNSREDSAVNRSSCKYMEKSENILGNSENILGNSENDFISPLPTRTENDTTLYLDDIKNTTPIDINISKLPRWTESRLGRFFGTNTSRNSGGGAKYSGDGRSAPLRVRSALNGVRNLGNTCFISAICQALFAMQGLSADLLSPFWRELFDIENLLISQYENTSSKRDGTAIASKPDAAVSMSDGQGTEIFQKRVEPNCFMELFRLARMSHTTTNSTLSIGYLKNAVTERTGKFGGYSQHDAHEFLSDLITLIHEDMVSILTTRLHQSPYQLSFDADTCTTQNTTRSGDAIEISSSACTLNHSAKMHHTPQTSPACSQDRANERTHVTSAKSKTLHIRPCDTTVSTTFLNISDSVNEEESEKMNGPRGWDLLPTCRQLQSNVEVTLRCTTCGHERIKKEEYNNFSLLLSRDDEASNSKPPGASIGIPSQASHDEDCRVDLTALLDGFFAVDKRDLSCEKCNDSSAQVEVLTAIRDLPNVLILHLKRFHYDLTLRDFRKITRPISFPAKLNMSRYTATSPTIKPETDSVAPNTQSDVKCVPHDCEGSQDFLASTFRSLFPLAQLPEDYVPTECGISSGVGGILGDRMGGDSSSVYGGNDDVLGKLDCGDGKCLATPIVLNEVPVTTNDVSESGSKRTSDCLLVSDVNDESSYCVNEPGTKKYCKENMRYGMDKACGDYSAAACHEVTQNIVDVMQGQSGKVDDTEKENWGDIRYTPSRPLNHPLMDLNKDFKAIAKSEKIGNESGAATPEAVADGCYWVCSACTFNNNSLLDVCEICETNRFKSDAPCESATAGTLSLNRLPDFPSHLDSYTLKSTLHMVGSERERSDSVDSLARTYPDSPKTDSIGSLSPPSVYPPNHQDTDTTSDELFGDRCADNALPKSPKCWSDIPPFLPLPGMSELTSTTNSPLLATINGIVNDSSSCCVESDLMYELVSVVRHVGRIAEAGHYTCDVKRTHIAASSSSSSSSNSSSSHNDIAFNGARGLQVVSNTSDGEVGDCSDQQKNVSSTWNRCDDAYVYHVSEEEVLRDQSTPYILVYQRSRA